MAFGHFLYPANNLCHQGPGHHKAEGMKRSDFFKSLLALPLISLFVKKKAHAEPIQNNKKINLDDGYEPYAGDVHDCPPDYVPFYPYTIEDCDHSMWFLDKHNPDLKQRGIRCMNCGWRPNAYELFRTINDPPKEPKQNGIYTVTTGTWNKPNEP